MDEKASKASKILNNITKIKIHDLHEIFVARKIFQKVEQGNKSFAGSVDIDIRDFFAYADSSLQDLSKKLKAETIEYDDPSSSKVTDALNQLFDSNVKSARHSYGAIEYYNDWLATKLGYLKNGDSCGLEPIIKSFEIDESFPLHSYKVTIILQEAIVAYLNKLRADREFKSVVALKLFDKGLNKQYPAVSMPFMVERVKELIEKKYKELGSDVSHLSTDQLGFRHAILESIIDDTKKVYLESPLSIKSSDKPDILMHLEVSGLIEILNFKCKIPTDYENIIVEYMYRYPPKDNLFQDKLYGLYKNERNSLSEVQQDIHKRVYLVLEENLIFSGRPILMGKWMEVFVWLLKKVTFNLEDADFLSKKYKKWKIENPNSSHVEDNFFLPFMFEKLKDSFGDKIVKKPKAFGGELDLIFDNEIPIELKVRKNQKTPLSEIIDDHYKALDQARAYAAKSRIGIVCVLDIPEGLDSTTNLDNCVKNFSIKFDENLFNTSIVVFIFSIRLKSPST